MTFIEIKSSGIFYEIFVGINKDPLKSKKNKRYVGKYVFRKETNQLKIVKK